MKKLSEQDDIYHNRISLGLMEKTMEKWGKERRDIFMENASAMIVEAKENVEVERLIYYVAVRLRSERFDGFFKCKKDQ
jgi:hypothetical protein